MERITESMSNLDWSGLVPAGLCLALGIVLLLAGRRVLRPGVVGLGALIGAAAGWAAGAFVAVGLSPWIAAGIGAALGGFVAWLAYRLAVAFILVIVFAAACPLIVWTAHDLGFISSGSMASMDDLLEFSDQQDDPAAGLSETLAPFVRDAVADETESTMLGDQPLSDEARARIDQASAAFDQVIEQVWRQWEQTPEPIRPALIGAAVVGAVLGLVLGLISSTFGAVLATAACGAALALVGLWMGSSAMLGEQPLWLPTSRGGALVMWLITAAIAMAVQFTFSPRAADKHG